MDGLNDFFDEVDAVRVIEEDYKQEEVEESH